MELFLNLNEILNLLVCIGALTLVLRWKDLSPKRYWWIAVGIAVALSIITNPFLHNDPKILFEVPESLNEIANFVANTIGFFIIPLILVTRVFCSKSLWLKLLSIVMFIVYAFCCLIVAFGLSLESRRTIDKFDAQDGSVYLLKWISITTSFSDSESCVSIRKYQRIFPGTLVHRKSFAPEKTNLDRALTSRSDAAWQCYVGDLMVEDEIGQMRQRFPPRSSN